MTHQGKKYTAATQVIERAKTYTPEEAIELLKKTAYAKFDETVELHLRMDVDPRNASQQVRGIALLPHGLGKKIRVLVFAQGEAERVAKEAGADNVGSDDIIKQIEEGWLDFDIAIATQDMMGRVSRLGKILGRKGLMPNPKAGTVVAPSDLPRAVNEARQGRVEFKLDRTAIIHLVIGKVSFDGKQLLDNLTSVMEAIVKARPTGLKGQYIKTASLCTTMGPGVKLELKSALALRSS